MTQSLSMQLKRAAFGAALSFAAASASATLVFSDNFNANNFSTIWTVTGGNVDVGSYSLCNNGTAGICVDTEGTGPDANATFHLTAPIPSLVAGDYSFAFDWGNNDGTDHPAGVGINVLDWKVTSGSTVLASGSVNSGSVPDFIYQNAAFSFSLASAVTNAVIRFDQTGAEGDWGGTVIDNVTLNLTNAYAVPAPGAVLLFGLGLLGMRLSRARR